MADSKENQNEVQMQPVQGQVVYPQAQMQPGQIQVQPVQMQAQQQAYPTGPDQGVQNQIFDADKQQAAAQEDNILNQVPALKGRSEAQAFLAKVWGIVEVQLLITASISCYAMVSDEFRNFLADNILWFVIACVVAITTFIMVMCPCCVKCARKVPLNYALLFTFTISFSYIIAMITTQYPPIIVFQAGAMTAAMVLGLTLMALFATEKQMGCIYVLTIALIFTLIPMIIFSIIFRGQFLYNCITAGIIVLFSLYILIDTRMIMERFGPDDYIIAAIILYIDIIRLFLEILKLFGGR